MNVLPEKQKEVLQTLLSLVGPSEKEKGCLSYGIYRDIDDNNVFNLISEWETREQLNRHMQSDRFSVLLGTKSFLKEPFKIQIFTVQDTEGMEAVNTVRKKNETDFTHGKGTVYQSTLNPKALNN
jgi:quinol monooxygenase YgiN